MFEYKNTIVLAYWFFTCISYFYLIFTRRSDISLIFHMNDSKRKLFILSFIKGSQENSLKLLPLAVEFPVLAKTMTCFFNLFAKPKITFYVNW